MHSKLMATLDRQVISTIAMAANDHFADQGWIPTRKAVSRLVTVVHT